MISHQLQSAPITGYYDYLSRIHYRVNVTPHEETDSEQTMTETTTATSPVVASAVDDGNTVSATDSSSADNLEQQSLNLNDKEVTIWSSAEVQQWIEEQCQKFELKQATTEKFQMNGQALVLLTKHDFLRRSPDGGEILYYALQRLINPNKKSSARMAQNLTRNGSWRQNAQIVELDSDTDEHNSVTDSSSPSKPIVEEPDDPPLYRKSDSDTMHKNHQHQYYPHSFFHNNSHIHQPIFNMPTGAYYHQHQAFPNAFVYAHHQPHHVHPHMSQQQFFHPHSHLHFIHQNYSTMAAQGILIEVIDNEEVKNLIGNGVNSSLNETSTNAASSDTQEQFYLVTINGQRYVMNEEQVKLYVTEVQKHQQQQQQQQQFHHQQQQQQHQQQQFHPHQQQQYTYQ